MLANKQKSNREVKSANATKPVKAFPDQSPGVYSILQLQRTIGNRAVQHLLKSAAENLEAGSAISISTAYARNSNPIAARADAQGNIQPKREASRSGDRLQEPEPPQDKLTADETMARFEGNGGEDENRTGMPDSLKAGLEVLSGIDLSDIRVYRNSPRPAQLNALAYTQGTDIHLGPGHDKHLSHEGWHVVQQKQGRVNPTVQAKGVTINDDAALEQEATLMGARALQIPRRERITAFPERPESLWRGLRKEGESKASGAFGEKAPLRFLSTHRIIQKADPDDPKIPYLVHFDAPLTTEEFIQLANSQLNLDPKIAKWSKVKDHYDPSMSPVTVLVEASLIKKSRSEKTASELGLKGDDTGTVPGADERAEEFSEMPDGKEKQDLYDEIDQRYWDTLGLPKGTKIKDKTKQPGEVALWKQIRDEVLAQREFIANLPEKVQYIIRYSEDGVVITPKKFEQVVRIANSIEKMDAADLENYLSKAKTTRDLDALETSINKFLETKKAAPEKIKELIKKADDEDWDVDTETAKMGANTMFYLSLDQRIKLIKSIADGYIVGDEDEQTIIRLITSTPSSDVKALLDELKASESALLKKLESVIDGSENKEYYAALRNIIFKSLEPEEAQKRMQGAKMFPWADPGVIKAAYNVRFYYETVEYTDEGKIRVVYWINLAIMGVQTKEEILDPDEIIGLHFYMDEDFANAKKGETIFMPASNLLAFKNEQFSRELSLAVDVGLLFAGGAGLVAKGTRLARAIAILDTVLAVAGITINSFRSDIAKTEEGRKFLKAWDTVNTLIAIYGIGKVVVRLPDTFRNLRKAYQSFKGNPGKIDPGDLSKIDNEVTGLFGQADKAALESEILDLRKKFSPDEMAAFEKQLEKAAGITDAKKRQAALADIESQISTQQENAELVAELQKTRPDLKNKDIADLAKPNIKVPTVPHGMTAEEFQEAQGIIKKFLQEKGLNGVEGFATGSRITGVTFNPKKPKFGQISTDFSGKDFDITLITSRKLTNSEVEQLQKLYKAKLGHSLGIRNIVDKKQLDYIPIYGKIDLDLK